MFEFNKLPYNKHALKVLLSKQDEILNRFYSLDTPINIKLIQYNDRLSKHFKIKSMSQYKSSKTLKHSGSSISSDILNDYYNKIKLAIQVKDKLLEDVDFNKYLQNTPKIVQYASYDFTLGLCERLNTKFSGLPIQIGIPFVKLWEILETFNLIPHSTTSFKILHLYETTGELILCAKYWAKCKCLKLNMNKYEWMANSLNPYDITNKSIYKNVVGNTYDLGNLAEYPNKDKDKDKDKQNKKDKQPIKDSETPIHGDDFGLIKNNYDKWLWGADNTGDITNVNNIKNIKDTIKEKWLRKSKIEKGTKYDNIDLIICDDNLLNNNTNTSTSTLYSQKLELSQIISVLACSSIGGSCCVKHFIPYRNILSTEVENNNNNNINESDYFIGYLYIYCILFDSISLYKPNTSKPDNGEFYVIGKGFKGITDEQLENLYNILDGLTLNTSIINKDKIPESFKFQIINFLDGMSNINIISIEKQNLLLTCFKSLEDNEGQHNYKQTNKILKCDNFFNKAKIDNMLIPKYREWIKIFNFE